MCSGPFWPQPVSLLDQALPCCWPPRIHLCSPVVCVLSPGPRGILCLCCSFSIPCFPDGTTARACCRNLKSSTNSPCLSQPASDNVTKFYSCFLDGSGTTPSPASTTTVLVHFILIDALSKYRSPASHLTCFCSIFHIAANYPGKVCI